MCKSNLLPECILFLFTLMKSFRSHWMQQNKPSSIDAAPVIPRQTLMTFPSKNTLTEASCMFPFTGVMQELVHLSRRSNLFSSQVPLYHRRVQRRVCWCFLLIQHLSNPFFFKEFATIKFVVCCTTSKLTVFMYECVLFCFGGCVLSHFILIH